MPTPSYRFIVNPIAGSGRAAAARPVVEGYFGAAGLPFDVAVSRAPGHAVELACAAAAEGVPVVVAVGGDGTVLEVVEGLLAGSPCEPALRSALGVIPVGTGNDFAWGLGLAMHDARGACEILAGTGRRRIDLGRVTDETGASWVFVNQLGAGLVAAVALESHGMTRLRGLVRYLAALSRVIPRYRKGIPTVISGAGTRIERAIVAFGVGNGPRTAGGFLITPDARMDDRLLDVVVASSPNLPVTGRLVPLFLRGTHVRQARYVTVLRDTAVSNE